MKKLLFFAAMILVYNLPHAAAQTVVNATKVETMLKTDPQVQLIDLRTPGEIQQTGKIAGAKQVDFNNPAFQTKIATLDKQKPVIVYCAVGGRSARAAAQMAGMGFKKVYDYSGGMSDWLSKGKKTVH